MERLGAEAPHAQRDKLVGQDSLARGAIGQMMAILMYGGGCRRLYAIRDVLSRRAG